jgi:cytidylate kinase
MSSADSSADTRPGLAPGEQSTQSPQHGFQGNRTHRAGKTSFPAALTIAVSREAGARGGTIARRVGRKLNWQVYNQELLDYIAQEGAFRDNLFASLPGEAPAWAEDQTQRLSAQDQISKEPAIVNLVRTILAVSAPGEVVLLGRGAGGVLPRKSTLHVRLVAPLEDRISYMSQWLRLTMEEATEQVRVRDHNRTQFIQTHFRRQPGDIYQYDLVLNSSLLGEDICVDLIVQAARAKQAQLVATTPSQPWQAV